MKLLVVLLVVLAGVWFWRGQRRTGRDAADGRSAPKAVANPLEMVRCQWCAVHLPLTDALPGKQGHYCSNEHRAHGEAD